MKTMFTGLSAVVVLAALTAGCGYSEHTYAVQAPAYERPVAVPGATYYYDYPTTTYVYPGY
jgi:hypothetical protein